MKDANKPFLVYLKQVISFRQSREGGNGPALKLGATFTPGFVFSDAKEVTVPADEQDPESYAKAYFLAQFGLCAPSDPVAEESGWIQNAYRKASLESGEKMGRTTGLEPATTRTTTEGSTN